MKVLPGGQLGFVCNDPALSHPYTGDTVNWKWLIGITLFLPFVVVRFLNHTLRRQLLDKGRMYHSVGPIVL